MMVSRWSALALVIGLALPSAAGAQRRPRKTPPKSAQVSPADVQALSGPDLVRAAKAAESLGLVDAVAAHDALIDALALGLPPAVAVPAIEALVTHPGPKDVDTLRRYARHHAPAVRSAALAALAAYPSDDAHAAIAAGLRDRVARVRAAAAAAAARGRVRDAVDELLVLLGRGEDSSARALGAMADNQLALRLAEQLGKVPDATLARALGTILLRTDFGPDDAKVEVVRTIAKIQDPAAVTELTDYVNATPARPARASREEAAGVIAARKGGGQ